MIGFIDIIGFKSMVSESCNNTSKLDIIMKALQFLKTWEAPESFSHQAVEMEEDYQKRDEDKFNITDKTNCTCFSDSIAVSVQVDDGSIDEAVSTFIANLSLLGAELLRNGILIRGGITIGELVHSESGIIVGPAMIEAYELESNVACYPRIILSDKLIEKLNYPCLSKRDRYPYHQYLQRFDDGCVGFHQMIFYQVQQSWIAMSQEKLELALNEIRRVIIEGLDKSFQCPSIYRKYYWLKKAYDALIILDDSKKNFYNLNENIVNGNIHYSYTDDYYKTAELD